MATAAWQVAVNGPQGASVVAALAPAGDDGAVEWWELVAALGPPAVLAAALIGAVMAYFTLRQRARADRGVLEQRTVADSRSEWWRRAQWALEAAVSDHPRRRLLGLAALAVLAESELASEGELSLLDVAWEAVELSRPGTPAASARPGIQEATPADGPPREVRAAAARLRVVLDRRLGRPTPAAVESLAGDQEG